ncbi:hypothetical protein NDU88_000801 [Pleurodeles waltl]|uniref:Uncharacterized protein n=1 Tax=Pleurodeles waltl TaxID=8319 RepID=A0AAV7S723_PLEWA|nr:hypothetical protein NDU88_000801 [Pleurodeles waltl]
MRGSWESDAMLECGEMTVKTAVGGGCQHAVEVALEMVCYAWNLVCGLRGYCGGMRGSWESDAMLECGEMTVKTAVGGGCQHAVEEALYPGEINTQFITYIVWTILR